MESYRKKYRLLSKMREFIQQTAFGLQLQHQFLPGSLACWPNLEILNLASYMITCKFLHIYLFWVPSSGITSQPWAGGLVTAPLKPVSLKLSSWYSTCHGDMAIGHPGAHFYLLSTEALPGPVIPCILGLKFSQRGSYIQCNLILCQEP